MVTESINTQFWEAKPFHGPGCGETRDAGSVWEQALGLHGDPSGKSWEAASTSHLTLEAKSPHGVERGFEVSAGLMFLPLWLPVGDVTSQTPKRPVMSVPSPELKPPGQAATPVTGPCP